MNSLADITTGMLAAASARTITTVIISSVISSTRRAIRVHRPIPTLLSPFSHERRFSSSTTHFPSYKPTIVRIHTQDSLSSIHPITTNPTRPTNNSNPTCQTLPGYRLISTTKMGALPSTFPPLQSVHQPPIPSQTTMQANSPGPDPIPVRFYSMPLLLRSQTPTFIPINPSTIARILSTS